MYPTCKLLSPRLNSRKLLRVSNIRVYTLKKTKPLCDLKSGFSIEFLVVERGTDYLLKVKKE